MAFKNPIEQAQALILANPTDQNATKPQIVAKPQRFTERPRLENYGLNYDEGPYKEYKSAFYYSEPDDIDGELARLQTQIADPSNKNHVDFYTKKINALSNPDVQRYLKDRNAYNSQFEKDYNEYYPTAKEAIIRKLLSDGDLYQTRVYGKDDYRDEIDDIGDSINAEFAKKYGYKERYGGELFSPLRKHGGLYDALGKEEEKVEGPDGRRSYRTPYDKGKYIGELLRSGELTLDDLKRYILGK